MAHPVLVPANPPPRAPPGDRWLGRGPPPDARDGGGLRDRLRANGAPPSPIDQPAQKSAHHRPGNLYGNLRTGFPVGIVNLTSFVMEFRNPMLSRHHARNFLTKLSRAAEPKLRRRLRRDVKLTMPCERSGRSAQTARTVRNRPVSDMAASAARNKFDVSTSARLLKISRAGRPRFRGHGGSIPTSPPLARRARDAPRQHARSGIGLAIVVPDGHRDSAVTWFSVSLAGIENCCRWVWRGHMCWWLRDWRVRRWPEPDAPGRRGPARG